MMNSITIYNVCRKVPNLVIYKSLSSLNYKRFENDFNQNHIPTNVLQKTILSLGSAAVSLLDPKRGDMIACLGETTCQFAINHIIEQMNASPEGQEILREQPRINTKTVDLDYLSSLPPNTLGKTYSNWLKENGISPDSRLPVQFVDNIENAYIMQRYREAHDLFHTILGMKTNMLGEVTVKWVEAIQTKLPMCIGGAVFGAIRLRPKHRQLYLKYHLPWGIETGLNSKFLLNIYFEKRWEQSMDDLFKEYNIKPLIY